MPILGRPIEPRPPRPKATVADWLLVLVAISTLVLAALVAVQQTRILSNQADLMRVQYLPMLQLKIDPVPDSEHPEISREHLFISNTGGIIRAFTAVPIAFIMVETTTAPVVRMRLPFTDYYGDRALVNLALTGNGQGDLGVWKGLPVYCGPNYQPGQYDSQASWLANRLEDHIQERLGATNIDVYTETIVRVNYRDVFGEGYQGTYQLNSLGFGWTSSDIIEPTTGGLIGALFTDKPNVFTSGANFEDPGVEQWFLSVKSTEQDLYALWQQEWEARGYSKTFTPVPATPIAGGLVQASPSPGAEGYWRSCN
jgi:hypothetical protein